MDSDLPESLGPGESANVGFSLTAPLGGVREWQVPLLADGHAEPVAILRGRIEVPVTPPHLMEGPGVITWNRTAGDGSVRSVVIRTLEDPAELPWIRGASADDGHVVVEGFEWHDQPDLSGLVVRTYEFQLNSTVDAPGRMTGLIHLDCNGIGHAASDVDAIPFAIDVRPRYAVFPAELVLDPQSQPVATVVLLDRSGMDPAAPYDLAVDGDGLTVERVDNEPRRFRVSLAGLSTSNSTPLVSAEGRFLDPAGEAVARFPVKLGESR